jgi:GrpE protein
MDEGPQVTDPGDAADPGALRDVTFSATETATDSGQRAPAGTAQDADQADDEPAGTEPDQAADASDEAPAAEVTEGDRPGPEATPQPPRSEPAAAPPPEPAAPEPTAPEPEAPATPAGQVQAAELHAELADLGARLDEVAASAAELSRLRSRDTDLIAKLHDDVTRLRSGELAAALNPVVTGMIKLHDQMISLGAIADPASPVGMLHTQLLQIMELTCAVRPFMPAVGEPFDASQHTGTRRRPTADASLDGTIAAAIKAGFVRADGSVVRVAEVEVHRLSG